VCGTTFSKFEFGGRQGVLFQRPNMGSRRSFNGTVLLPGVAEKPQRMDFAVKTFFCAYPVANGWFLGCPQAPEQWELQR
jgi:hypothetical protein